MVHHFACWAARVEQGRTPLRDLETIGRTAVWRAWQRYRPDGRANFNTYAQHFVRGAMLAERDFARGTRRNSWTGERWAPQLVALEAALEAPDPADPAREALARVLARQLLRRLSPRQRRVLVQTYLHGMTAREIAAGEGLSEDYIQTVRGLALRRLRAQFGGPRCSPP